MILRKSVLGLVHERHSSNARLTFPMMSVRRKVGFESFFGSAYIFPVCLVSPSQKKPSPDDEEPEARWEVEVDGLFEEALLKREPPDEEMCCLLAGRTSSSDTSGSSSTSPRNLFWRSSRAFSSWALSEMNADCGWACFGGEAGRLAALDASIARCRSASKWSSSSESVS